MDLDITLHTKSSPNWVVYLARHAALVDEWPFSVLDRMMMKWSWVGSLTNQCLYMHESIRMFLISRIAYGSKINVMHRPLSCRPLSLCRWTSPRLRLRSTGLQCTTFGCSAAWNNKIFFRTRLWARVYWAIALGVTVAWLTGLYAKTQTQTALGLGE
jgi:hypothetical protein